MALLFLNGTVSDGDGDVAEHGALLTEGSRIEAVGPTTTLETRRNDPGVQVTWQAATSSRTARATRSGWRRCGRCRPPTAR
jgi:hypothetical protein